MKARDILFSIVVFFIASFVIVYMLIQMISSLTSDVKFEYATNDKIERVLEKNCYIVRSEEVIYSVSESEKVGNGQLIATVYSNTQGIDVQKEIEDIDSKLAILNRSSIDTGYLTSDISKIDDRISESLIEALRSVENKDLSLIQKHKEDLLINMNKRELVTSGTGDFSLQIAELQSKKAQLTASLQNPISSVYSNKTGYFSTLLDGYETIFTTEMLEKMTLADFDSITKKERVEYDQTAIGKLITDFDWHALCEVTSEEAESLAVGQKYPVTYLYSSSHELHAILERKIVHTDSDRVVLVLRMEDVPTGFDYTRYQAIKIVLESKSGVSFPSSALRMVNNEQGVYIVAGNIVKFKKVDIISSSNSKFLSKIPDENTENPGEYLTKFDRVITEGKDLYVGKILD